MTTPGVEPVRTPSDSEGMSRFRAAVVLFAVVVLHAAVASWWMHDQGFLQRPAPPEAATQQREAADYAVRIAEDGVFAVAFEAWTATSHHTQLVPVTAGALGALVGDRAVGPVTQWTYGALWGVVLAVGAYRLARRFMSRGAAILAAALFLWAPAVHAYQRVFYWQYPMTALLPLALRALIDADGFRRWRPAAAFGAFLGLATLAKNIAPMYVVGSCVVAMLGLQRRPRTVGDGARVAGMAGVPGEAGPRRRAVGVIAASTTFALLVGPWFVRSCGVFLTYADAALKTNETHRQDLVDRFSAERWLYYLQHFVESGIGPVLAFAAVLGAASLLLFRRRERAAGESVLPRGTVVGLGLDAVFVYALTTFGQAAGASQYLQFLACPVAMIAAAACDRPASAFRRRTAMSAAALSLGYMLWTDLRSFDDDAPVANCGGLTIGATIDHWAGKHAREGKAVPRPEAEAWPTAAFAEALAAAASDGRAVYVELHPYVNHAHLATALRGRVDLELRTVQSMVPGAYFTLDPAVHPPEFVASILKLAGWTFEDVATAELWPGRTLRLCRIVLLPR